MRLQNITYLQNDLFPNVRSTTKIHKSEDTKVKRHKKVTVKLNKEMKIWENTQFILNQRHLYLSSETVILKVMYFLNTNDMPVYREISQCSESQQCFLRAPPALWEYFTCIRGEERQKESFQTPYQGKLKPKVKREQWQPRNTSYKKNLFTH